MKTLARVIALSAVACAAVAPQAFANKYGTAGCGLGTYVFENGKPGKMQILAATTNGTFGSQTFGISSGTSNCVEDKEVASTMFIAVNEQALRKDISRGEGEALAGLSQILRCDSTTQLGTELQRSYGTIFPSNDVSPETINQKIWTSIRSNAELAKSCAAVI